MHRRQEAGLHDLKGSAAKIFGSPPAGVRDRAAWSRERSTAADTSRAADRLASFERRQPRPARRHARDPSTQQRDAGSPLQKDAAR